MAKLGRRMRLNKPGETSRALGIIVPAVLKDRLHASALASGRTQSQETAYRLQRSFDEDALVERILQAASRGT